MNNYLTSLRDLRPITCLGYRLYRFSFFCILNFAGLQHKYLIFLFAIIKLSCSVFNEKMMHYRGYVWTSYVHFKHIFNDISTKHAHCIIELPFFLSTLDPHTSYQTWPLRASYGPAILFDSLNLKSPYPSLHFIRKINQ